MMLAENVWVQLASSTIACVGLAILYKVSSRQIFWAGIGSFITWAIYLAAEEYTGSAYLATMVASIFVSFYGMIMAKENRAPETIFRTVAVFPLVPGAHLYYMMYYAVMSETRMAVSEARKSLLLALAVVCGFFLFDVIRKHSRTLFRFIRIVRNNRNVLRYVRKRRGAVRRLLKKKSRSVNN